MKNCISKKSLLDIRARNRYKINTLYAIKRNSPPLQLLDESHEIDGLNLIPKHVRMMTSPYDNHDYSYNRMDIFKNPYQLMIPKPISSMKWGYTKHAFKD